ncbi:hypothetical protein L6V77_28305 [Myxococcota bacterium]|nr:hypothetical protein [Myxococcota bacterium]
MSAPRRDALGALEARLCDLYALTPGVRVRDFVVDDAARPELLAALPQAPDAGTGREALLIHEGEDELNLALLLEDRLTTSDPCDDDALDEHCALLEGVSHLLYVVDRAQAGRTVSRLELELQAEVDKFLGTFVMRRLAGMAVCPDTLRNRLFRGFTVDADPEARPRYVEASRQAERYCTWLTQTYLQRARLDALLPEVRRFWRMSQSEKLGHIAAR